MSARCSQCRAPIAEPARCSNGHAQPTSQAEALATALRELRDQVAQLEGEVAGLRKERPRGPSPDEMVDVRGAARILGVSPDTVYEHADELGVVRIGSGPKAHLRFDPERLRRASHERTAHEITKPQPRRVPAAGVPLLPVRGKAA